MEDRHGVPGSHPSPVRGEDFADRGADALAADLDGRGGESHRSRLGATGLKRDTVLAINAPDLDYSGGPARS